MLGLDADGDPERDARSASQVFDAVVAYLEFRAGSAWRRAADLRALRHGEYLSALRLMHQLRYTEPAGRIALADPPLYPGDRFFHDHPELEALADSSGRYVGYRRRTPKWIDRPEVHFPSCRCARHRLPHHASAGRVQMRASA